MYGAAVVREVEIFENERFSPMSGWSSKGLLMTDRKAFSTRDGSQSWPTLEQTEEALMSYGWEWDRESTWLIDTHFPASDSEGWSYGTNYESYPNNLMKI